MPTSSSSSAIPVDPSLYERIKRKIYEKIPKHSAYRSGILVKEYKKQFGIKYGQKTAPYYRRATTTAKKTTPTGLTRWFLEDWRNQRGEIGYKYKGDVYRPTRRVTTKTPRTFSEISKATLAKARKMKSAGKRARFW